MRPDLCVKIAFPIHPLGDRLDHEVAAGEVRELRPGATWVIPGNVPHSVRSGAEGAALIELFAPPRDDWGGLERLEPAPTASFGVAE